MKSAAVRRILPHFSLRGNFQVAPPRLAEFAVEHLVRMAMHAPELAECRRPPEMFVDFNIIVHEMSGRDDVLRKRFGPDGGDEVFPSGLAENLVQDLRRVAVVSVFDDPRPPSESLLQIEKILDEMLRGQMTRAGPFPDLHALQELLPCTLAEPAFKVLTGVPREISKLTVLRRFSQVSLNAAECAHDRGSRRTPRLVPPGRTMISDGFQETAPAASAKQRAQRRTAVAAPRIFLGGRDPPELRLQASVAVFDGLLGDLAPPAERFRADQPQEFSPSRSSENMHEGRDAVAFLCEFQAGRLSPHLSFEVAVIFDKMARADCFIINTHVLAELNCFLPIYAHISESLFGHLIQDETCTRS